MKEIFKPIPGYKGIYEISNKGSVVSKKRIAISQKQRRVIKEKYLRAYIHKSGYLVVGLTKNKVQKLYKLHQLIAMAFLNHKPNGMKTVVDHIDNNKLNNDLSNLQLISQRANRSKDRKGSSKYTGVSWLKRDKKWYSSIQVNGKSIGLGYFDIEKEAAKAYQKALKELV